MLPKHLWNISIEIRIKKLFIKFIIISVIKYRIYRKLYSMTYSCFEEQSNKSQFLRFFFPNDSFTIKKK